MPVGEGARAWAQWWHMHCCCRFLYNTFVVQPGPRRCAGAFCTFTDNTKKAVGEKRFNQFCSNGVLNFMMINSPGGPRKADDSDHPLKEVCVCCI
jgi:hypothetical protein